MRYPNSPSDLTVYTVAGILASTVVAADLNNELHMVGNPEPAARSKVLESVRGMRTDLRTVLTDIGLITLDSNGDQSPSIMGSVGEGSNTDQE